MTAVPEVPSSIAVSEIAATVRSSVNELDSSVDSVSTTWSRLSAVYSAPEAEIAYSALNPITDILPSMHAAIAGVADALDDYATALAALEVRRDILAEAVEAAKTAGVDSEAGPSMVFSGENENVLEYGSIVAALAAADQECSDAIRRHRVYEIAGAAALLNIPNSVVGSTVQGTVTEILRRYHGFLLVPGAGAVIPDNLGAPLAPYLFWEQEVRNGELWVRRPGSVWVRASSVPPLYPPSSLTRPEGWLPKPVIGDGTVSSTVVPWAKWTARGLGVLGAGFTLWGSWVTSYNDTLVRHPEWTEDQRHEEAWVDTAVVGGSGVAGGIGGAWGGVILGASVGSLVPGIGTVIGGIIGGIAGGVAGGWMGGTAGQFYIDGERGDSDLPTDVLAPGPFDVQSDPPGLAPA